MNRDEIIDSLGRIDEDMIRGVESLRRKKNCTAWVRWGAMAACLCLIAMILVPILGEPMQGPQKLNLEGAVLENSDGSLVYHTDNYDDHIIAFTMVLERDIPYSYAAFTAYNILNEQTDNQGVIHQETEDFKIITQCPYYEKLPSYTTTVSLLTVTVNGEEVQSLPTTAGRYEVVIDYSALYICFDVVEKHVEVYPFADLVIDSDWFAE